ncbi:MAG: undecaprenyl-diphosphate phosphatase [Bacteroidetes bacterium]|nr:undecaprenyl-diphosphate phosphatase [Bacteroidota bacterium]
MTWLEALIMGIVQGLSEFLPISSSGHLEIFKVMMGIEEVSDLTFSVVIHGGTALSTVVVYFRTIRQLAASPFGGWQTADFRYLTHILIAAIPVIIVGLFFKDEVEALFDGNLVLVGSCLLLTAGLLYFASRAREGNGDTTPLRALIVGIAQGIAAILPGLSRSGSTISTALLLGMSRTAAARFSFLIVLIPIFGAMSKDCLEILTSTEPYQGVGILPLAIGFVTAFLVGLLACTAMIRLVKRGGLMPFAIYCLIVGAVALYFGLTR